MPRVANPPAKSHGRGAPKQGGTPQKHTPVKIPLQLQDDAGEKEARFHNRQAMHDWQLNQIKAAVKTPLPPARHRDRAGSDSPMTPRERERGHGHGQGHTPVKRVPILANFEEWMKMATDNKINATNSWNFALIDYFHDMSLLREGDGVNFQKASCTLDGCVKIYTSRVDSVATETGKLLSGLADSNSSKGRRNEEEEDDAGEDDATGEDGEQRRTRKKQRSHEATLAPSFSALQLKKFELEFAVDPLFKKASADFDEGGAKGLLLNHLSIDNHGRIVFDSSDDIDAEDQEADGEGGEEEKEPERPATASSKVEDVEVDLAPLANKFFPNLDALDEMDICPSLKDFSLGDGSGSLDIPALRAPDDWRQDRDAPADEASGIMLDDEMAVGFDDDDDGMLAGFDLGGEVGFGEGGEAWAREAALEPLLVGPGAGAAAPGASGMAAGDGMGESEDEEGAYTISLAHRSAGQGQQGSEHEQMLNYFDNAMQRNWAGPEHWKIRRLRDAAATSAAGGGAPAPKPRKEKEAFSIDFAAPLDPAAAEMIYTPANTNAGIALPKTQWKTKGHNLLPDDKHFNSRQLLRLFLKPKARMELRGFGTKKKQAAGVAAAPEPVPGPGEMDEAFWAAAAAQQAETQAGDEVPAAGTYDADFFADNDGPGGLPDDDDDDDDNMPFADAREAFSPEAAGAGADGVDGGGGGLEDGGAGGDGAQSGLAGLLNPGVAAANGVGGYGSQLVTQAGRRVRPEYMAYARVAKKVDIRRLKEEMWRGMGARLEEGVEDRKADKVDEKKGREEDQPQEGDGEKQKEDREKAPSGDAPDGSLRFTSVMNGLTTAYPEPAMRDISTSYCFICLLHLANEKGLVLSNGTDGGIEGRQGGLDEVFVARDAGAVLEGEVEP